MPFSETDLGLLKRFIATAERVVLLPYVIAEASNLVARRRKDAWRRTILRNVLQDFRDDHVPIDHILQSKFFNDFGATDTAIIVWLQQRENRSLITNDARLSALAQFNGFAATNMDRLRFDS